MEPDFPSATARLPYPDMQASPEVARIWEGLSPRMRINLFRMAGHAPTLYAPLVGIVEAVLGGLELQTPYRELVILYTAHAKGTDYEWAQHVPIAGKAGVSEAKIAAIRKGEIGGPPFDEGERLVLRFADEQLRDGCVSDATFAAAKGRFTPRQIVELTVLAGAYAMLAGVMRTTALTLEKPPASPLAGSSR
jgi:alkylhydroperoxidase family enzyme